MQFGQYRGCGSMYVLWLRAGAHANASDTAASFASMLESSETPEVCFSHHVVRPDPQTYAFPRLVPRDEDGPHADPTFNCYLFSHPDEFGYSPAAALAVPPSYFKSECLSAVIDPLLVPSGSEFGHLIAQAKSTPEFAPDELFPSHYLGCMDENDEPELQWVLVAEVGGVFDAPDDYFVNIRRVMAKHFELMMTDC